MFQLSGTSAGNTWFGLVQSNRVNPDLVNPDIRIPVLHFREQTYVHYRFCNLLLSSLSGPFIPAPDVNYPVFPD